VGKSSKPQTERKYKIFIRYFLFEFNENFAGFDFHQVSFQVHANRRPLGLSRCEIKPPIVLGTFNQVAHHQAACKMHPRMGAMSVRSVKLAVAGAVNGKGSITVVEANYIFRFNLVNLAGFDPIVAHGLLC